MHTFLLHHIIIIIIIWMHFLISDLLLNKSLHLGESICAWIMIIIMFLLYIKNKLYIFVCSSCAFFIHIYVWAWLFFKCWLHICVYFYWEFVFFCFQNLFFPECSGKKENNQKMSTVACVSMFVYVYVYWCVCVLWIFEMENLLLRFF